MENCCYARSNIININIRHLVCVCIASSRLIELMRSLRTRRTVAYKINTTQNTDRFESFMRSSFVFECIDSRTLFNHARTHSLRHTLAAQLTARRGPSPSTRDPLQLATIYCTAAVFDGPGNRLVIAISMAQFVLRTQTDGDHKQTTLRCPRRPIPPLAGRPALYRQTSTTNRLPVSRINTADRTRRRKL